MGLFALVIYRFPINNYYKKFIYIYNNKLDYFKILIKKIIFKLYIHHY